MADTDQDQKTEQPTEKKLSEAFDRGQFARSPELTVLLLLAGFLGVMGLTAKTASREIADYAVSMFTRFGTKHVDLDTVPAEVGEAMLIIGRIVGPLM